MTQKTSRKGSNPVKWISRAGIAILLLIFLILAYYQLTRTSWLEALSLLNPQNVIKPSLTPSDSTALFPQKIVTDERWGKGIFSAERTVYLPENFKISLFASGLGKARMMAMDAEGNLFITLPQSGKVAVLPDRGKDGFADEIRYFAEGLEYPTGISFHDEYLYVAGTTKIYRLGDDGFSDGDLRADGIEVLAADLPAGGNHVTRTIAFTREGKMLVSVGSSCNICEESERRGAILLYGADGKYEKVYASGLRNSVGVIRNEQTGEIWATDNGRDFLGDDLPPEEVNAIKEGKHYGWPYCHGDKIIDPEFNRQGFCGSTEPPVIEMQAHSAPLGLRFYFADGGKATGFPDEYDASLFIAFHGSWNRREPTGYKVVSVKFGANSVPTVSDFLTGFLVDGKAWGRPVDVIVGEDGEMYVSDDFAGAVYRIAFSP